MTPLLTDCAGLWRRTLLIEVDGTRDAEPGVLWLQSLTAYVDSRGFAGTLHQDGDVFEWHRDFDITTPGPHPDAGVMHWEGDVLVETGVHEHYIEHWVRDSGDAGPTGALYLSGPAGASALLVRVGTMFGWADGTQVVLGTVGGDEQRALGIDFADMASVGDEIQANGVHWTVDNSEGNVNS
ncbi:MULTISPECIES: hypothetical protein [Mycobacteriaceae]|uniref:Uncharacterized protein n=1 Tax=Mycolicibacterium mucogenicum DSM 44124 TaxID=1226753 RepID=A0A8E4R4B1_MYCMU|nr:MULTISPECIES: hypothetical protein [Mycobacteriaceae]KAB7752997.1 hypothetical protein MMUC44124_24560 [Mycolicibacterium mucogenicum DSM 44124]QPG67380.1 hypothetical protein C1S78_017630 [Mycolicibacterium mucogenicum DSM 44124]SEB14557.1 hypothetical protein SAMN04488580_10898 [Mycobacterium sp. 283mftsu]